MLKFELRVIRSAAVCWIVGLLDCLKAVLIKLHFSVTSVQL
jgi:hypothetical protein